MKHPWLTLLTFGVVGLIVLIFYNVSLKPIEIKFPETENGVNIEKPTITYVNPKKGAGDPEIKIVEFGDYECAHCKTLDETLNDLLKEYPDELQIVWKNMPNKSTHPMAVDAAVAAHCADRQNSFWEYHEKLFENQSLLTGQTLVSIAQNLNLNMNKFNNCLESKATLPIIQKDLDEALALKISATPTIFIGKERKTGAISKAEIRSLIEQALSAQTSK